ncbi:hypothetical protein MPL3356_240107 [Mesorhizobium plurifarium]|uniref:Uncharacterized protein n=1 Tax=Mesorhizobium plurifarium TaxID=69974 RepID=A0A090DTK7_MESPL|nr:hypothetical protein MPL3356_240107 [Mesorhizobium plurifarium]CDX26410.1 hypothetical protein MPLDJ20_120155 [Mesorhizobium plurifarium]CDX58234.1 hypothetical protein MPL3365_30032 [Mesorhizobium plurifarium]
MANLSDVETSLGSPRSYGDVGPHPASPELRSQGNRPALGLALATIRVIDYLVNKIGFLSIRYRLAVAAGNG